MSNQTFTIETTDRYGMGYVAVVKAASEQRAIEMASAEATAAGFPPDPSIAAIVVQEGAASNAPDRIKVFTNNLPNASPETVAVLHVSARTTNRAGRATVSTQLDSDDARALITDLFGGLSLHSRRELLNALRASVTVRKAA